MTSLEPDAASIEVKLSETERRFRTMADSAPVLLWMSREDSLCTFFNQTWVDFTGRSLEQEWGVGWAEGVHFEDLQHCLDTYVDAFNARQRFEMEYRLRRADGEYRWILDRGVPRYADDGTFAGFIGSCVDITDRKTIETDLRSALAAKDNFLGMVSHELRTPLTALHLQLERLRRDAEALTEKQRDIVQRMGSAASRLTQLIESVLQFSRIERGRLRVEPRPFDLEQLVHECIEELRSWAEKKGLVLTSEAANLPRIHSDPALVRLVLNNLINNAIKFTDRGEVSVRATADGRLHRITVRDTGRGISDAEQSRIFEPFEQLEPSRGKHTPGVGLGLSLAKAMTSALGGQIQLESQPGVGSVFTLALPSRIAEEP